MCERDVPQGSTLRKCMNRVSWSEEQLAETLNEEQRKLLETLMDNHMTLTADLKRDAFTTGLRLGARLMMEIHAADDSQNL